MKKMMRIALAMIAALSLLCAAASADEIPQPEGGKKFESCWGMRCGLVQIDYEEEGYRVMVDLYNQDDHTGTLWQYSCYYIEEKDVLESVSSSKNPYTLDEQTLYRTLGETEYEGIDDPDSTTVFSLSEDGALTWQDGHENIGQELEFRDIGNFEGVWRNDEEAVYTEFHWEGLFNEETYCYSVYVGRGADDDYADFHLVGLYNPETGKLECYDTAAVPMETDEALFAAQDDGVPYDAFFTDLGGGKLLYEAETGIELEYDILGPES